MERCKRAVIVGAGIAGSSLAIWLRRSGWDVVVGERRSREQIVREGAFLGVAPNGMRVLQEMGCAKALMRLGTPCAGFEFRNARDRVVGQIDSRHDEARYGAPLVIARRADLQRVLLDDAHEVGAHIRYNAPLQSISSARAPVITRFGDGSEWEADVGHRL